MLFKLCDVVETRTTLSIDKNGVWALFKFLLPLYLVLYLIISLCLGLPTDQTNHALLRCGLRKPRHSVPIYAKYQLHQTLKTRNQIHHPHEICRIECELMTYDSHRSWRCL